MFIGELGVAFFIKKKFKSIPMWVLFFVSMFTNLLTYIFVFFGIEKMSFLRDAEGTVRIMYDFVPYSLSFFSAIVLGLLAFLIFSYFKEDAWGIGIGLSVVLSWIPKILFHSNQIPLLWDNAIRVGFASWENPVLLFILELCFLGIGFLILFGTERKSFGLKPVLTSLGIFVFIAFIVRFCFPEGEQLKNIVTFEFLMLILFLFLTSLLEKKQTIHGKRVFWSEKEE